ncbi:hypothetical protein [Streptomyces sp. NPDC059819]|uniref:hypothetical protein n=1 Tax=Streptomyces sp. NPDC059819 TaxID=3346963 RepID=UPI0036611BB7
MDGNDSQSPWFYTPRGSMEQAVDELLADQPTGESPWLITDPAVGNPWSFVRFLAGQPRDESPWFLNGQHRLAGLLTTEVPCGVGRTELFVATRDLRSRLRVAAYGMRVATTAEERREAAREFLGALAELIACLIGFVVRLLLRLLSGLLGRATAYDVPAWTPMPLERTPQIAPRGPNPAFPVNTHRGGHQRSTLGSVVLAA